MHVLAVNSHHAFVAAHDVFMDDRVLLFYQISIDIQLFLKDKEIIDEFLPYKQT